MSILNNSQLPWKSPVSQRSFALSVLRVALLLVALTTADIFAEVRLRETREYDLKAAFLYNFAQFVDWPPAAFFDDTAPFVIGVLGDDPFGKSLDEIVANETVHRRKIVIKRYRTVEEITSCHILFISQSEHSRLDRIFKTLADRPILTVGETDAFTEHGGMIRFELAQNRLHIRINVNAAKLAKLVISSKLLRQAEILDAKND